jgi:hypothetical protein
LSVPRHSLPTGVLEQHDRHQQHAQALALGVADDAGELFGVGREALVEEDLRAGAVLLAGVDDEGDRVGAEVGDLVDAALERRDVADLLHLHGHAAIGQAVDLGAGEGGEVGVFALGVADRTEGGWFAVGEVAPAPRRAGGAGAA